MKQVFLMAATLLQVVILEAMLLPPRASHVFDVWFLRLLCFSASGLQKESTEDCLWLVFEGQAWNCPTLLLLTFYWQEPRHMALSRCARDWEM